MTIYRRSDTDLDAVSMFMPVSALGRGAPRTLRARMRLSRIGFLDTLFPSEFGTAPSPNLAPAGEGSGFDWNKLVSGIGDVITAKTQADLTKDLYQMNLERARQGLSPISASQVAPQMNVGVAPDVQRTILTVGLGAAAILGGAYAFGVIGKGRGARRRRR